MNKNLVAVLILFGLILLSGCQPKEHLPELRIAYNVLQDTATDNYEVYTMNLDGSDKQNVTHLPGVEWTYYSYQEKLFFISDQDTCHRCYFLWETNSTGDALRKITDFPLADSWMSSRNNGQELIVRPHSKVDSAFYIIDLNGQLLERLWTGLPQASDPMFINDGQQVVFRGGTEKSKRIPGYREELFIINPDGTGLRQLTHYPENDTTAPWYAYKAGPPRQHPTEGFITYQSFQNGKYSLYAINPDGSNQHKLTNNLQDEGWHDWSHDGQWLAIEIFDTEQTQFDIALMNWNTKEIAVLTDTTFQFEQAPNFVWRSRGRAD